MKTSFAKTFSDLSKDMDTKDSAFPERKSLRIIIDETNMELNKESIFVIWSYDETFSSDNIQILLANSELRSNHHKLVSKLNQLEIEFLDELEISCPTRKNIKLELFKVFEENNFINLIKIIKEIVSNKIDYDYSGLNYDLIFNDKVADFLNDDAVRLELKDYIDLYDNLLDKSRFLKFGFNHYKANKISKEFKKDNFFEANHSLNLYDSNKKKYLEVKTLTEYNNFIEMDKNEILNNEELKLKFKKIDLKIKNQELEDFRDFITDNQDLIKLLPNLNEFAKKVWMSHIVTKLDLFEKLYNECLSVESDIKSILNDAKKEQKVWREVISEFNNRFFVPFEVKVGNQDDIILKDEKTPIFEYVFKDISEKKPLSKTDLLKVLCMGEKKAFYLLNIIFEIKSRQLQNKKTLFIIDDIADSFDYKNKYAIVEYLNDLSQESNFSTIILTHNFDFFRTLQSRILNDKKWDCSFISEKLNNEIKLINAGSKNVTDPFNNWKKEVNNNEKYLIACISFVRNLIEFKEGNKVNNYLLLTHCLHYSEYDTVKNIKATTDICIGDLELTFSSILSNIEFKFPDKSKKIFDIIFDQIETIKKQLNYESIILEDKIIFAIGIRLKAEQYMKSKLSIIGCVETGKVFQKYKDKFKQDFNHKEVIKILESVNIMTPENIHLNSFMYEPILDMGIDELKNLYDKVSFLK